MTTIQIVKIYDALMVETIMDVLFIRNGKTFSGGLFFKPEEWEHVEEVLEEVTIDDADEEAEVLKVIQTSIEMKKRHEMNVYDDSERTMKHWQFVNGFSNVIFL